MKITTPLTVDKHVTKITDADGDHILDIRGYEAFLAKGMDPDEAEEAQEEMARIIVDRLNAYDDLEEERRNCDELANHYLQTIIELKTDKEKLEQDLCNANENASSELADALVDKVKAESELEQVNKQLEFTTMNLDSEKIRANGYKDLLDEYTRVLKDLRECLSGKASPDKMKKTVDRLEELKL